MGIFTSEFRLCDKCGKTALFDGPYSDCGCYTSSDGDTEMSYGKNYTITSVQEAANTILSYREINYNELIDILNIVRHIGYREGKKTKAEDIAQRLGLGELK